MKLLTALTLGLLTSSSLLANTTMCYKENHKFMATIENTKLDGGECSSTKSVNDMKNDGWSVADINIEKSDMGSNYIYIFKKEVQTVSSIDEEKLEQKILEKLEKRKSEEIKIKKREAFARLSKSGKNIYVNTCQRCHGEDAAKKAYGTSRPLIDLSLNDFKQSIRDYKSGDYNRGMAMIMKPYAFNLGSQKVKEVYTYIKSLKPEEQKEEATN